MYEPDEMKVVVLQHEPDPVIKEVMEDFTKNIATKIKLVNLLKEGDVREEIFQRLFGNYISHGKLLLNSRKEMLERVRYDLGSMEQALVEAKEGLEEIEIRKTIGDISDEEYAAKSPGFKWDIKQYEDEVGKKKDEIAYLMDIRHVISPEQIKDLSDLGKDCFDSVDTMLESKKINDDMASKIKTILEEAITNLRV